MSAMVAALPQWIPHPFAEEFHWDRAQVTTCWATLHAVDLEPLPQHPQVLDAWVHYHNGHYAHATALGLQAGPLGLTVANKATCIYAHYLERSEARRLALLQEAATRAEHQVQLHPDDPNAHYVVALALGRYAQCISVAKALAQGLGPRVKKLLELTIHLQPGHVEAHVSLGAFHADVIDKVGPLIGSMTYGVRRETSLSLLNRALTLAPQAAIVMTEYAHALRLLDSADAHPQADALYHQALAHTPLDATERLQIEMARAQQL